MNRIPDVNVNQTNDESMCLVCSGSMELNVCAGHEYEIVSEADCELHPGEERIFVRWRSAPTNQPTV